MNDRGYSKVKIEPGMMNRGWDEAGNLRRGEC